MAKTEGVKSTGPAMPGLPGSPNPDSNLADALQDSLQAEAATAHTSAAQVVGKTIASAVSQGIDDSSLGLSLSPVQASPFAGGAASQAAASEDLTSAEADTAIAANLRRTLNRLNTLSLPVALVTAKSDALPDPAELPPQVSTRGCPMIASQFNVFHGDEVIKIALMTSRVDQPLCFQAEIVLMTTLLYLSAVLLCTMLLPQLYSFVYTSC